MRSSSLRLASASSNSSMPTSTCERSSNTVIPSSFRSTSASSTATSTSSRFRYSRFAFIRDSMTGGFLPLSENRIGVRSGLVRLAGGPSDPSRMVRAVGGRSAEGGSIKPRSDAGWCMEVKSRHHLRSDEVREIEQRLADRLGVKLNADSYELVELEDSEFDLVLVDGDPAVLYFEEEPFLTVRGANEYEPQTRVVTVDAGAVSFVSDGADVMRPGIVEADDDIAAGDLVAIAEESHGKVLG